MSDPSTAVLIFVSFLFALCFHEFAHAWMAKRLGDNTAQLMGRLTMNPVAHADIIGTVILPIMAAAGMLGGLFFAWAKPVPVNPNNLQHERKDMFWIAFAGPGSNLLLAFVSVFALVICYRFQVQTGVIYNFLKVFIQINLVLAFFNLIPIHPLDGGKILARFLPEHVNRKLEDMQHYSMIILLVLLITGALRYIQIPIMITGQVFVQIAEWFIP